jgi:hypothetical protein
MEATASPASLYTLRGSYENPDKSQKPQCYLWLATGSFSGKTQSVFESSGILELNDTLAFIHSIHPIGAQAGARLTGFILNSDQNLKNYLATVVALLIHLITSPLS